MAHYKDYTDEEIIEMLLSDESNEDLIEYLFFIKLRNMFVYVSHFILPCCNYKELIGDFYVHLRANNWHILRQYKGSASLYSYMSRCAINFFSYRRKLEEKYNAQTQNDIPDMCDEIYSEEYDLKCKAIKMAYASLNRGDRDTIDLLIIKQKSALEAADTLWQYTKKKDLDWHNLPTKSVQDTIAMSKRKACFSLAQLTYKYMKELESNNHARASK